MLGHIVFAAGVQIDPERVKADIQKFVAECLVCQQNKVETIKTPGLLQPLSIPSQRWEEVSMDFITGLPKSEIGRASCRERV